MSKDNLNEFMQWMRDKHPKALNIGRTEFELWETFKNEYLCDKEGIDALEFKEWCDKYAPEAYRNESLAIKLQFLKDVFLADVTR